MSYTVYVLESDDGHRYKGMTNNLTHRLEEHKSGKTKSTKGLNGLKVVYREDFDDFHLARKRELYFKTAAGRRFLNKVLGV